MNLAEFARWAIENGAFAGTSLDGGSIQDKAEACGIIVKTKYDPQKHGCNDVGCEPGDDWYLYSSKFKTAEAEIERLSRFLEIALDAYEDVATDPNIGKPGHFVTQARKLLGHDVQR